MATAKVKRPLAPRTNDVDRLATKFASGLKIADTGAAAAAARASRTQAGREGARGKAGSIAKATVPAPVAESPEESRAAAMRSVNGALQSLSAAAAATSAAAPDGKSTTPSRATLAATASAGRTALNTLRKLSPGLVDAERAALNLAGKLLALDMDALAFDVLVDVRAHLPSHYTHAPEAPAVLVTIPALDVLQLPLPTCPPLDVTLQTCVSAYFTYALPAAVRAAVAQPAFCAAVDGSAGLKAWVPYLTALPIKARDALLKRAYVALTTATTGSTGAPPPLQVLRVRFCALRILLLSAELEATPFWEQCLKYAAAYARCADAPEKEGERVTALLACFAEMETVAEGRREGKGWIAFCEYWLALAKRAGDMDLLNRVASYIRNEASTSNDSASLSVRLCAALTQLTAALDQLGVSGEAGDETLIADADSCSSCLRKLRSSLASDTPLDSKLRRAVERCRRSCLKSLGRLQTSSRTWDAVRRVSEGIVDVLEQLLGADTDATVSALDTLFQLATAGFVPQRADTCDRAYDYLARAARIVERVPVAESGSDARACANYTRCLAGAFANVAGTLYKAERHSFALRFLLQACPLSVRASALYDEGRAGVDSGAETEGKGKGRDEPESEKDREAWKAHRTQIYRRWELLGVCYMKIGDRKLAYDAFVQGIVNYPFAEVFQSGSAGGPEVQLTAEANRPLVTAIDRITHLSTVELRLDTADVSLLSPLNALGVSPLIIGAVLMLQVASLAEGGGRAKPGVRVAIGALLRDLLGVYEPVRFPVRRARVLVLVLEHAYYGGDEGTDPNRFHMEEVAQEAQRLLSDKVRQYIHFLQTILATNLFLFYFGPILG
ncbi:hypothetical protein M0805_008489 [Coniferiporia weirii]|nr:hypothetical protein M0805_008489 [Coniferiporia weirii]